jgi:DNA-binding cell septation regulator SpoVG
LFDKTSYYDNIRKAKGSGIKTNKEDSMEKLTFKVEKMYRLPDAGGLKVFFDMSINDVMVIRGCRIVEGKKGKFISMPQEQGKDSKWYDQCIIKSTEVYEDFCTVALKHYEEN